MIAFLWSVGALLLAFLISAHKARWLPEYAWMTFWKEKPAEEELLPPSEVTSGDEE